MEQETEQEMEASLSETEGQSLEDKHRSHKASAGKRKKLLFKSCLFYFFIHVVLESILTSWKLETYDEYELSEWSLALLQKQKNHVTKVYYPRKASAFPFS